MDTVYYTVQKGDTLYQLAKKYGTTVGMIARYNGIVDPDRILEGQELRIPVSEIPGLQEKMCRAAGCGTMDYIIRSGDTLFSLAKAYGITPQKLADYNGIAGNAALTAGDVLKIPLYTVPVRRPEAYTVKPGDTLWKIAEMFGTNTDTLAAHNTLENPDLIKPGQVLRLPPDETGGNTEGRLEYTVKPGDTLWLIAQKYGVSVAYLINLNSLTQPDLLVPGQVLVIRI